MDKVFITGASSGLGRGMATLLSNKFEVHNFSRSPSLFINHQLDLLDDKSVLEFYKAYKDIKPKIIILNSGIKLGGWVKDNSIEDISKSFKVNFEFNARFLTLAYNDLIKNDTKVLVISSIAGYINTNVQTIYGSTKHAMRSFMEGLQAETKFLYGNKYKIFKMFAPGYISGTKMTPSSKSNVQDFAQLATDFLFSDKILLIPEWDKVYKNVKSKYDEDPILQGLESIQYKLNKNRIKK